jgi:exodeoxyribonuclease VII large subunit
VQGKDAPADIAQAIEFANSLTKDLNLDVLILGRGGGSLEDLQAFNDEQVARAIFASSLPIVSAVGHEVDFTIADFVADLRAPTPSAAAELLSPDQEEYQQLFKGYAQQLFAITQQRISSIKQQLSWQLKQLRHPGRRLLEHAQTLDILEQRLSRALKFRAQQKSNNLSDASRALRNNSPLMLINQLSTNTKNIELRLIQGAKHNLKDSSEYLIQLSRSLNAVSPLSTLGRGYSITYDENNEVLSTSDSVKMGSRLTTRLNQGQILSEVVEIKPGKKR